MGAQHVGASQLINLNGCKARSQAQFFDTQQHKSIVGA